MIAVVLIWSYVTVYPGVIPFLLFPVFFFLARVFRPAFERVNSAMLFFFAIILIGFVTYLGFVEGTDRYVAFLKEQGVEKDAVVTNTNDGEVELRFDSASGQKEVVRYTARPRRFFPSIEEPILPPKQLDRVRILYYPGVEAGLIVLTDPRKSEYGAKLACAEAERVFKLAEKAYNASQTVNGERRAAYRSSIEKMLAYNCFAGPTSDRYREIFSKL